MQAYDLKVAVVLPTRNEAENIITLIPTIRKVLASFPVEIVVVDDDSQDRTAHVAEDFGAVVIQREKKRGLGSAIREGVRAALWRDVDIIVQMDADWQHDPRDIPRVLQPVLDGQCSFALGCREVSGSSRRKRNSSFRALISQVACLLANLLLGMHSTDPTSGFRAFDKLGAEVVLDTLEDGYAFQVEVLHNLRRIGLPVREVSIRFQDRLDGQSKLTLREVLEFLKMLFKGLLGR